MSRPGRARNPRGEGSRLREEILAAAIGLVDETGDPGTLTLRGVARQAGISAPSIYAHFDDLDSLSEAVLSLSFDHLRDAVSVAIEAEPKDDSVGRLVSAAAAYVQFAWDHPARYRLMFQADGYADNAIATFTLVQEQLAACVASGVSRSTDIRLDVWMLWAGLHGVATLEKPARVERRRLGIVNRPTLLRTIVLRLARIEP